MNPTEHFAILESEINPSIDASETFIYRQISRFEKVLPIKRKKYENIFREKK